jgi:hypothetical protein
MKQFKIIDFWVSVGLIMSFIFFGLYKKDVSFVTGYFVVGGWQIISMLVHFFNHWFCGRRTKRYHYHITVMILVFLAIIVLCSYKLLFIYHLLFLIQLLYYILFALLFTAPFMAIFYAYLCYNEVHVKMKRPLDLLK